MPSIALPPGTHYAVTWGIPDQFAGMTTSMLQRSRAFVKYAGVDVTIVTFEPNESYQPVRERLRELGAMVDGMHLVNMWEDLRSWGDDQLRQAAFSCDTPDGFEPIGSRGKAKSGFRRELLDDRGKIVQTDHLRDNGTPLVCEQRLPSGDRVVTLCDRSGQPLGSWRWFTNVLWLWLDSLPRDPVAWMIIDSKSSAEWMVPYQRPDVAKMHVVRGSHLRRADKGPMGELFPGRSRAMQNLDAWDAVTFLTHRQKEDVEERFGPQENLNVIPNSRRVPTRLRNLRRRRDSGVMLATLDRRKRIEHAIQAMAKVQKRLPGRNLTLDVWGQGPRESDLQEAIESSGAPVRLRGHSPNAAEAFSKASFSVLTSRAEAFANVIIESMGRGCIPISYDTPYGPSDIITHGVDGYLVPFGDVKALAVQIEEVISLSPWKLAKMRRAAHRRALEFSDERSVRQWESLMAKVAVKRGF